MLFSTTFIKTLKSLFTPLNIAKTIAFTALFCLSGIAGKISIPGTAVGITTQTLILMLAAIYLSTAEGVSALLAYITLGAAGLPVFSGGMSTAALIGPSAGFIWGFIPAFVISHSLIRLAQTRIHTPAVQRIAIFAALILGCIITLYIFGVSVQSIIVSTNWIALMTASMGFLTFDIIKAIIAISTTFLSTSPSNRD